MTSKDSSKNSAHTAIKRGDWLKRLRKWAPEYSGVRLYNLIHDEVLIKGQTFTKEKADDFKKGTDLLGDLFIAYEEFKAEPQMGERGPFSDMMGQWLCDVDGFNVRGGQFFTPIHICDFMASVGLSDDPVKLMEKPERMMDPAAGTGRFMLSTAKHYAKVCGCFNFIYWNIDIDQRAFIYSTVNAILNGIPSFHIHGDSIVMKYWEAIAVIPQNGLPMWHTVDAKHLEDLHKQGLLKAAEERRAEEMKPRSVDTPFGTIVVKPKEEKPKEKKEKPRQATF